MKLELSPIGIEKILKKDNWQDNYREEFLSRLGDLNKHKEKFSDSYFINKIHPLLLEKFSDDAIREQITKSINITFGKSMLLIKMISDIPKLIAEATNQIKKYGDAPVGPLPNQVVEQMDEKEKESWKEATLVLMNSPISLQYYIGVFVSELFFAYESMCRTINIASCYVYALKALDNKSIIQHGEIHKTLKRLTGKKGDNLFCTMCPINHNCKNKYYSKLAAMYEVLYHLRGIKDYRNEFLDICHDSDFFNIIIPVFGIKAIEYADDIMNFLLKGYIVNPISISKFKEALLPHIMDVLGERSNDT